MEQIDVEIIGGPDDGRILRIEVLPGYPFIEFCYPPRITLEKPTTEDFLKEPKKYRIPIKKYNWKYVVYFEDREPRD